MSWNTFQLLILAIIGAAALGIWMMQGAHAIADWLHRRRRRR